MNYVPLPGVNEIASLDEVKNMEKTLKACEQALKEYKDFLERANLK